MKVAGIVCDACNGESGGMYEGVAALPGLPASIRWCVRCLAEEAVPPWVASHWIEDVGLDELADWALESKVWHEGRYLTVREYAEVR